MKLQLTPLLFIMGIIVLMIIGCSSRPVENTVEVNTMVLKVVSPSFAHENLVPKKYTCQGQNISPPLYIDDVPPETKSLVLIVEDPDAPMGTWDHWIVWNIPKTSEIKEGKIPEGAIQGMNSWGDRNYGGPCPPTGTHKYFFKVFALDTVFDGDFTKDELMAHMRNHILAKGEMVGLYRKM